MVILIQLSAQQHAQMPTISAETLRNYVHKLVELMNSNKMILKSVSKHALSKMMMEILNLGINYILAFVWNNVFPIHSQMCNRIDNVFKLVLKLLQKPMEKTFNVFSIVLLINGQIPTMQIGFVLIAALIRQEVLKVMGIIKPGNACLSVLIHNSE